MGRGEYPPIRSVNTKSVRNGLKSSIYKVKMMYSEGKKETANRSGGSRECFKLKLLIPSGI